MANVLTKTVDDDNGGTIVYTTTQTEEGFIVEMQHNPYVDPEEPSNGVGEYRKMEFTQDGIHCSGNNWTGISYDTEILFGEFGQVVIPRTPDGFSANIAPNQSVFFADTELLNGAKIYGGSYEAPGYEIGIDGRVYLFGLLSVSAVADDAVIFKLSEGYAPQKTRMFTVAVGDTNQARLDITNTGDAILRITGLTAGYLSLEGISFQTDPADIVPDTITD